jgi:hypothetical protein
VIAELHACWMLSSATVVQDDCSELVSVGQQVARVAHVPVGVLPPLLLPELEPLLEPLLLPELLLEEELHWLEQFDSTQLPTLLSAVEQPDAISLATHDELVAALCEYVPPGQAQEI